MTKKETNSSDQDNSLPETPSDDFIKALRIIELGSVLKQATADAKKNIGNVRDQIHPDLTTAQREEFTGRVTGIGAHAHEVFDAVRHALQQDTIEDIDTTSNS